MTNIKGSLLSRASLLGSVSFTAFAAVLAMPAMAQTPAPANGDIESVVVTGSRITIPGFASPTPVTAISPQELSLKGITNFPDLINEIPELQPFVTASTGSQDIDSASVNLRGIGATRTLLLVDGRRFAPTQPTGGTDVNVLPAALIKSVDVVTGGASAAYGSDAVAGVVEVTLDDKFEGLKGNIQMGSTTHMDAQELSGSVQAGTSFLDGRGHIVVALDAYTNNGALQGDRSWGQQEWGIVSNPNCTTTATCIALGQTRLLLTTGVKLSSITNGGVIVSGPLQNIQFGVGGNILKFNPGTEFASGSTFAVGGDGEDLNPDATILGREHRNGGFTHLSYDVTSDISVWGEVLYTDNVDNYNGIPNYSASNITISRGNPFVSAALGSLMDANKITSFVMGRTNLELGWEVPDANVTTQRYAGGLDGHFGENWKWSAYGQFSFNNYYSVVRNNLKTTNFNNAVNAVSNPAVGGVPGVPVGTPVCASTLANPNDGCDPINVIGTVNDFGPSSLYNSSQWTPAQLSYVSGTSFYNETQSERDFAFNIQGQPLEDWAGPVAAAAGAEYRREGVGGTSDPLSQAAGWRQVNAVPLVGSYNVAEGYLETDVPLLRDVPWVESLDINAAGRITSYSTSGMVETWKYGFNYQPIDELRFRATASDDIRAPNVSELYQARAQNTGTLQNPFTGLIDPGVVSLSGGNANLKPETGRTYTAGVVYQPAWLDGFSASADYYQLHLTGAITTLASQTVVNDCAAGETALCSSIVRNGAGQITTVYSTAFNAQTLQTDGWDFEGSYGFPLSSLVQGWGGDFRLHAQASWTEHLTTTASGLTTDAAGYTTPHWRWNVNATYTNDPITFNVEGRWVGNSLISNTYVQGVDINDNQVDGRFYVTLSGTYALNDTIQIYSRVDNLFDVDPPVDPGTTNAIHSRSSTLYDVIGRDLFLGFRLRM